MRLVTVALLIGGSVARALADDGASGWNGIPWGSSKAQVETRFKIEIPQYPHKSCPQNNKFQPTEYDAVDFFQADNYSFMPVLCFYNGALRTVELSGSAEHDNSVLDTLSDALASKYGPPIVLPLPRDGLPHSIYEQWGNDGTQILLLIGNRSDNMVDMSVRYIDTQFMDAFNASLPTDNQHQPESSSGL